MTTTYEDTQHHPGDIVDGEMIFGVPNKYDLWLAVADGSTRYVRVNPDSANPTRFVVTGIPATVHPADVALHLQHIAIWPHPDKLLWMVVSKLPRGTLVRGFIEDDAVRSLQIPHWSGAACIGWMCDQ